MREPVQFGGLCRIGTRIRSRGSCHAFPCSCAPFPVGDRGGVAVALVVSATSSLTSGPTSTHVDVDAAAAVSNPATIDPLPTAQMNGVGWSQAVGGNAVYVAGQFTKARPAGSAAGSNETTRNNFLAYDINTGNLTSFAPSLNSFSKAVAVAPNGTVTSAATSPPPTVRVASTSRRTSPTAR